MDAIHPDKEGWESRNNTGLDAVMRASPLWEAEAFHGWEHEDRIWFRRERTYAVVPCNLSVIIHVMPDNNANRVFFFSFKQGRFSEESR